MISIDTFRASIWWLGLLFKKERTVHKTPTDKKPQKNAAKGRCGINATTMKQVMATIHQGRNRPAAKLNTAISIKEDKNFIVNNLISTCLFENWVAVKTLFY